MSEEKNDKEETLYSRWLEGKLSNEELAKLKESGADAALSEILRHADSWSMPELSSDSYQRLEQKTVKKTRHLFFSPIAFGSMAAALALIVVLAYSFFFTSVETIRGEQALGSIKSGTLPDGNQVKVLANSELSYGDDFLKNKKVNANGLVFFDILKKGPFEVETEMGNVSVKGTKFDVLNSDNALVVTCYEGLVECTPQGGKSYLITPGKSFLYYKDNNRIEFDSVSNPLPEWLDGAQSYKKANLISVLEKMKVHFNIQFAYSESMDLNRTFTGKYYLNDMSQALNSVFGPLNIQYKVKELDGTKTVEIY